MRARPLLRSASFLALLAPLAHAGGSGENAFLIVDPTRAESLYVANVYRASRGVPGTNVLYMASAAPSYAAFTDLQLPAFLGTLAQRRIGDHVDFVVLPSGGSFFVSAPGYVGDGCFPVNRFSATAGYTLAHRAADILDGIGSASRNRYWRNSWDPQYFDSSLAWLGGNPSTSLSARRYFIGALLGYTGPNGNTLAEVLDLIARSVAVDGTHPSGTVYYMETTDPSRSGPRDPEYPLAVSRLALAGGVGEHLFDWLPLARHDALGIMTGFAANDIDGADLTLLPGSFADHLTSFAATFDDVSQTKMSRWISKGASGTAGTVEEPCNYPGKFPHPKLHVLYRRGLTLGESWFRSLEYEPFQNLFVGDPLTRPWAEPPTLSVPDAPLAPVAGTVLLTPVSAASAAGAGLSHLELLVDGVLHSTTAAGGLFTLDTTRLDEGWHELRILAYDDTPVRNVASWVGELEVANESRTVALSVASPLADLGTLLALDYATTGGPLDELQLLHNERVVASASGAAGSIALHAQMLGAGEVALQARALYTDGRRARSRPLELTIAYAGTPADAAPVAFGFEKRVGLTVGVGAEPFVLELPASFSGPLEAASYTLLVPPAQATVLAPPVGPWCVLEPRLGARGTETLSFRVTTALGSSEATITLRYAGKPLRR